MSLTIIHVKEHGDLDKEYIVLAATGTINLWNYMISDSTYHGDGTTSNKHRHVFDFDELLQLLCIAEIWYSYIPKKASLALQIYQVIKKHILSIGDLMKQYGIRMEMKPC